MADFYKQKGVSPCDFCLTTVIAVIEIQKMLSSLNITKFRM